MSQYRKNIVYFASCGRRKTPMQAMSSIIFSEVNHSVMVEPLVEEVLEEQEILEETVMDREKIKLKMNVS